MIVSVLLALILIAGIYIASHRLDGAKLVAAFALLLMGGVFVVFPAVTTMAAHALGVGRGTDLLLYFITLTGIYVAAHLYFRSERQARQLATVVRDLALLESSVAAGSTLAPNASRPSR